MNEPIRPDKGDRYVSQSAPAKKPAQLPLPVLSKKKWIILILALCVLVGLLGSTIFRSAPDQGTTAPTTSEGDSAITANTNGVEYQTLVPPIISPNATETVHTATEQNKERIEISGDVTDVLANKIEELNAQDISPISLNSQNTDTNPATKELVLPKNLNDSHYTIQINSSSSFESIMAFVKTHKLTNYQIYETKRDNKPWFVLIKGYYATIEDAKQAVQHLAPELQKSKPWIKSGAAVNKEKTLK